MGTASVRVLGAFICALICVNQLGVKALTLDKDSTAADHSTTPQPWRFYTRGSQRYNTAESGRSASAPTISPQLHNEIKELMTSLHDRVGILATLDEDQRHRLEVIDKKLDQMVEANTGRMESLKVQQLNFQQRLDSFEHIQRLTRHTLDELKGETDSYLGSRVARQLRQKQKNRAKLTDLSRHPRETPQQYQQQQQQQQQLPLGTARAVQQNVADIFSNQSVGPAMKFNLTDLDVNSRLDALATFLVSLAYNVQDTRMGVNRLIKDTNNIKRRLIHRGKGQNARLPQTSAVLPSPDETATSCLQSYLAVKGIIKLQLTPESEPFYVPCEDDGWTVILNRSSDDVSFQRGWLDYKEGFGNLAGDFFIGLDKLHALTSSVLHELRIELEDFDGNVAHAGYDAFAISGERELYSLQLLGQFETELQPSAGDSLSYQAGAKFSTFDSDNDNCLECSCAQRHKAAGWFNSCATSNLFGIYHQQNPNEAGETGIFWDTFQGKETSLRRVKLLIRPVGQDEARR
ncbi:angiopoietin-4 isoform X1 [Drosophila sulfurigaster albostrigata]|uniref:angiopoietin-4 isoform X1 n=1 Tax=Drosophila sulfurigaster albostrigata TaxID=89887 RepID=UPI002D21A642|nr:angiopoietin-4 isoform X1 [Drosophila sulfurigaster albostrigata]